MSRKTIKVSKQKWHKKINTYNAVKLHSEELEQLKMLPRGTRKSIRVEVSMMIDFAIDPLEIAEVYDLNYEREYEQEPDFLYSTFGSRFKELRRELGITQGELAKEFVKKTNGSLTKGAISNYENGKRIPEVPLLIDFAKFFRVTVDYLLGLERHRPSIDVQKKCAKELLGKKGTLLAINREMLFRLIDEKFGGDYAKFALEVGVHSTTVYRVLYKENYEPGAKFIMNFLSFCMRNTIEFIDFFES